MIVKEALANGRLTGRGDVQALRELAERSGTTPDALALAAVLRQPWADVVLSGAATVHTLESNLKALEFELSADLESELVQLTEDPVVYWEQRSELPWN